MEERMNHMLDLAEEIFQGIFECSIRDIIIEYEKQDKFYAICSSFEIFVNKIKEQNKEKICYFGICYLLSSLASRNYELTMTVYDESFILDSNPVEYFFRIPLFYKTYEKDMDKLTKEIHKQFIRVQEWEIDMVRRKLSKYYYAAMLKMFIDWKDQILRIPAVNSLYEKQPFVLYFGRYQGEGTIL